MKKILGNILMSHAAKTEILFFAGAAAFQGVLVYKACEQAAAANAVFQALPVEEQEKRYNSDPANKVRASHDFFGALTVHQMRNNPASHEHMKPLVSFDQIIRR